MNTFYETFGFVAALCAGVIILAVFFTSLGYFKRAIHKSGIVPVSDFVRKNKWVSVQLRSGRTLPKVRFVGFTESSSANGAIPHQLSCMAVFESEQTARMLIRADSIAMIEEMSDVV